MPAPNRGWQMLGSVGRVVDRVMSWMRKAQRDSDRTRRDVIRCERRANRRSLTLLLKQLNPEQRREFRHYKHFHVIGGSTGERYRIRVDLIGNIDVLRYDGKVKYRLCVRPAGEIPVYDVMAAQLLHLQDAETEQRFLQRGNVLSALPEDHICLRSTWAS
ncbi:MULTISPECIES: hypothetical protein [Oxalobacteraceae]|uniref:hypothetical protein n=1 Tax=Oxalobacteraceae TaxID=75682 RepID=UPI0010A51377|nr:MULTISPECIES: hypothetical protein [Oxalobacteraceae]HJV50729.1 hypothetical protein [Noviherbaspirillum sp.]